MLGRLRMDIDEVIEAYQRLMLIFGESSTVVSISPFIGFNARYNDELLTESAKILMMQKGLSEEALLQENPGTLRPVTYGIVLTIQFRHC